jgi:hypothetical protein
MRYQCYQLYVKHPLPHISEVAQTVQGYCVPPIFHSLFCVGTALVSADESDPNLYFRLLATPEAYFFEIACAITRPLDRASFLLMLESIGRVSSLLCYRVEILEYNLDNVFADVFLKKWATTKVSYLETCQALYLEVYGKN